MHKRTLESESFIKIVDMKSSPTVKNEQQLSNFPNEVECE